MTQVNHAQIDDFLAEACPLSQDVLLPFARIVLDAVSVKLPYRSKAVLYFIATGWHAILLHLFLTGQSLASPTSQRGLKAFVSRQPNAS